MIELKYPRNEQYPEQMNSFCKDIDFLEQLKTEGFTKAFFIAFADDRLFYEGNGDGIYGYFRNGQGLTGELQKPTGNQNESVTVEGNYTVMWEPVDGMLKYMIVVI